MNSRPSPRLSHTALLHLAVHGKKRLPLHVPRTSAPVSAIPPQTFLLSSLPSRYNSDSSSKPCARRWMSSLSTPRSVQLKIDIPPDKRWIVHHSGDLGRPGFC